MAEQKKPLPDFENPPVVEVALSVQFAKLPNLRTSQLIELWKEFGKRFATLEEHPAIDPAFERFGVSGAASNSPRVQLQMGLPPTRWWFLSEGGADLIQVQQDRFIHNWRKLDGQRSYPHYDTLINTFEQELSDFGDFLARHNVGELVPNQCEVTYINNIVADAVDGMNDPLGHILTVLASRFNNEFLPAPENAGMSMRFVMRDGKQHPFGRLHIQLEPVLRATDGKQMFLLTLTARGQPLSEDLAGVLSFLSVGHEWVVRGFADITTQSMHQAWGRTR